VLAHNVVLGFAQVLLRDPSDENVIPIVEELRRRLAPPNTTQHDGKENLSGHHDVEGAEEDGKLCFANLCLLLMTEACFSICVMLT
jgi:hypothetical protein